MAEEWTRTVSEDGPAAEFISEVTRGAPPVHDPDPRRSGPPAAVWLLIVGLVAAGAWVAGPGRSGAPPAPLDLPAYGEAIPRQDVDLAVGEVLTDSDVRLMVFGLQPGFTASDPDVLSVGPDGTAQDLLGAEVWWGERFGGHPGAENGLVTSGVGSLVVASGGRAVARDVDLAEPLADLGRGIAVLRGPSDDTVWIVTSAGRSLRLVTLPGGLELSTRPIDLGRPLASGPEGLVMAPSGSGEPFRLWQPHRVGAPHRALAGSEGGSLLGLGGGRVVIAADDRLLVYAVGPLTGADPAIEPVDSVPLTFAGVVESELSPDGRHLAIGRLTEIYEPDVIDIVDVDTGAVVQTISPTLGLSFGWIDEQRLGHVTPRDGGFHLVATAIDGGDPQTLLRSADLNWFHHFVPVG